MKKRILTSFLVLTFIFINSGVMFAYSPSKSVPEKELEASYDQFQRLYKDASASGESTVPNQEWYEEMVKMYEEAMANPGKQVQPSEKWMQEMKLQSEKNAIKVEEQINLTGAEWTISSATDVYTGTNYNFTQANCGAKGEYGDCDEDAGNFTSDWGTTSGGYCDALSQYVSPHVNTATTWSWVGNEILVHGSRQARITFDGHYAHYILGDIIPTYSEGTVKVSVFNATDGQEVASKTIVSQGNPAAIPSINSDDFTDYLDVNLVSGKKYYLKMQVWAYVAAGRAGMADLISASDIPARGGDGVDYHSIKISWL